MSKKFKINTVSGQQLVLRNPDLVMMMKDRPNAPHPCRGVIPLLSPVLNSKICCQKFDIFFFAFTYRAFVPAEDLKQKFAYKDFEKATKCRQCHTGFYEQWTQAMMSQAYTHHWDEIEYFELAVAQAEKVPAIKEVVDGCNGCRMPYFDPDGNMTIMQWNTAKQGVDYRISPRETKMETFTFQIPFNAAPGEMRVTATLNYQLLVKPVADLLNVPAEESEIRLVNSHSTHFTVLP
ncbi:MAG: multiheme c-type cytochrome [Bacteroidales bacterium]|nr:multiheme c-type cytochrome [Bacteroidales bacterium]